MDKIREEFEVWVKSEFDIDCGRMIFGRLDGDRVECYHDDADKDGAIAVSAMLVSWQASRAALCVKLPESWKENRDLVFDEAEVKKSLEDAGVRHE